MRGSSRWLPVPDNRGVKLVPEDPVSPAYRDTLDERDTQQLAAIDLREVAPRGSAEADRQTAAFYMLARHALTRHWWIAEEDLIPRLRQFGWRYGLRRP